jgi:Nitrile hydratase, alpha chain
MEEKATAVDPNHPHVGPPLDPPLGVQVIAKAWADPGFRARLLAGGRAACQELGAQFADDAPLVALENTYEVHHLVMCPLCNAYPKPGIGSDGIERRVSDTTAAVRYIVLPVRPVGTANFTEAQLLALVPHEACIGAIPTAEIPRWSE